MNSSVVASAVIAFPAALNITDTVPLLYVPASSSLNTAGVDIILATPAVCAADAIIGGSLQCAMARAFAAQGGLMYYLGTAAALGMGPAPEC